MRSNYTYKIDGEFLFIEDLNTGDKSVTNDIEEIVKELAICIGPNIKDMLIIYRDSDGVIDGIDITDTTPVEFAGFYIINETDYETAKQLAR